MHRREGSNHCLYDGYVPSRGNEQPREHKLRVALPFASQVLNPAARARAKVMLAACRGRGASTTGQVYTGLGSCDGRRRQTTFGAGGGVISQAVSGTVSAGTTAVLYVRFSAQQWVAVMLRTLTILKTGGGWSFSDSKAGGAGRFLRYPSVSRGGKMGAVSVATIWHRPNRVGRGMVPRKCPDGALPRAAPRVEAGELPARSERSNSGWHADLLASAPFGL